MTGHEHKKIDIELKAFTAQHFLKPAECTDAAQISHFVRELASRIGALQRSCNYAPPWAYTLLAQYNARHNSLLYKEFTNSYR